MDSMNFFLSTSVYLHIIVLAKEGSGQVYYQLDGSVLRHCMKKSIKDLKSTYGIHKSLKPTFFWQVTLTNCLLHLIKGAKKPNDQLTKTAVY